MHRGTFTLLGTRKIPTVLDTKVGVKVSDNVEPVLASAAIPDPEPDPDGTAMVKPRPTVKHYASSASSNVQHGLAVPTPKVPLLPPTTGGKAAGREISGPMLNGMSIFSSSEDDIFMPPPPLMEPPPPPTKVVPPTVGSFSSSSPPDLPAWLPPSPKAGLRAQIHPPPDFTPPPVTAPSKGTPGLKSTKTYEPVFLTPSSSPSFSKEANVAPFSLPTGSAGRSEVVVPKVQKVPPMKPNRLSSLPSEDGLSESPGPSSLAPLAAPSSFNPQNKAKIYTNATASILSGQNIFEHKPNKPIIFVEDPPTDQIPVQFNGKTSTPFKDSEFTSLPISLAKPAQNTNPQQQKDLQDPRNVLYVTIPDGRIDIPVKGSGPLASAANFGENTPLDPGILSTPYEGSSKSSYIMAQENKKGRSSLDVSRRPYHLDRVGRGSRAKESPTSPMALLLAAKEREKRKSSSMSESTPLSPYYQEVQNNTSQSPDPSLSHSPSPKSMSGHEPKGPQRQDPLPLSSSASPHPSSHKEVTEDFGAGFIPPPPEFANYEENVWQEDNLSKLPPSQPPPDPPMLRTQSPSAMPVGLAALSMEPKPPKSPPPEAKPRLDPPVSSIVDSQRTLHSILQKKQLEQQLGPGPDSQDQPRPDKDCGTHVKKSPANKKEGAPPSQSHNLFLSELENKVSKKAATVRETSSSGTHSKPSHGKTFTVRPGTRQPIMRKEDLP